MRFTFFRRPFVWALFLIVPLMVSCGSSTGAVVSTSCEQAAAPCLQGKASVLISTDKGDITLVVDGDAAPITAGNFVDLVRRGVYDDTQFHRVVREPVPFVVQGGDPQSSDRSTLTSQLGTGGFVDPDTGQERKIPLEVKFKGEETPRYNRITSNPSELADLELSHERGAVAMARSQAPDSASAQFYVALRPLPELDGRYAVFGQVTDGLEVVDAIRQGDRIKKASLKTP